jgi:NADPH:quinone reductase-like Zn-dependent oxidoreductase
MTSAIPTTRRVWRRTDSKEPGATLLELIEEPILSPLPHDALLIKVHAISLNYRDANITNGRNPWPVIPKGIPCCDAVGTIIAIGDGGDGELETRPAADSLRVGDVVTPIIDQASITGREQDRSWLAADVDGVLADYLVMHRDLVVKIPKYLTELGMQGMEEAAALNCAGLTAWSALKGVGIGWIVLVQGMS